MVKIYAIIENQVEIISIVIIISINFIYNMIVFFVIQQHGVVVQVAHLDDIVNQSNVVY
jgi:hypothetical protein